MLLRTTLIILTALLAGAHFLRYGNMLLVFLALAAPFLLLVKRRWSVKTLQVFAYLASLTWVLTTVRLIKQRLYLGEDWLRMALILGTVTLVSILAGLLLNSKIVKERYPSKPHGGE